MQMQDSIRVAELREFLAGTQGLQAEFIFRRAQQYYALAEAGAGGAELTVPSVVAQWTVVNSRKTLPLPTRSPGLPP